MNNIVLNLDHNAETMLGLFRISEERAEELQHELFTIISSFKNDEDNMKLSVLIEAVSHFDVSDEEYTFMVMQIAMNAI